MSGSERNGFVTWRTLIPVLITILGMSAAAFGWAWNSPQPGVVHQREFDAYKASQDTRWDLIQDEIIRLHDKIDELLSR